MRRMVVLGLAFGLIAGCENPNFEPEERLVLVSPTGEKTVLVTDMPHHEAISAHGEATKWGGGATEEHMPVGTEFKVVNDSVGDGLDRRVRVTITSGPLKGTIATVQARYVKRR